MSSLRSFVHRLLVQAIVSGTVMAGLQIAVRFGPELLPAPVRTATLQGSGAATIKTTGTAVPGAATASTSPFAQDRTRSDVRSARFPVWREREQTANDAIPPQRLAAKGLGAGLSNVMLFDRCRPGCESRDPLLAFNRRPATTPTLPMAMSQEVIDDFAVASSPGTAEVDGVRDVRPREVIVAVARSGLSAARRIVGW